jgi:hypothetical protein
MQDFNALAFPRNISSIHENLVKTQACEKRNATLKYISPRCLAQRKLVLMHHTINTHSQELYYQHHCKITVLKLNELCKFKGYDLRENKIWYHLYLFDF